MFSVIGGAIIYYIVMNIVLWLKLPSDDLKLFSAIVVAIFLAFPYLKSKYGTVSNDHGNKIALIKSQIDTI